MPARIYALAKELNLDSKELVDIVKKVGITGKGSALASLTDDETTRVRDHLAGASAAKPAAPSATASAAPLGAVRDSVVPPERKPMTLNVGRSRSRPTSAKSEVPAPATQSPPAATSAPAASDAGPSAPTESAPSRPTGSEAARETTPTTGKDTASEDTAAKDTNQPAVAPTPPATKAPLGIGMGMKAKEGAGMSAKEPSATPKSSESDLAAARPIRSAPSEPTGKKPGFASRIASRIASPV